MRWGFVISGSSIILSPLLRVVPVPWCYYVAAVYVIAGLCGLLIEYNNSKQTDLLIVKSQLHDILASISFNIRNYQGRINEKTLRVNIMRNYNGRLLIVDHVGMDNDLDSNIEYALGQGCCGSCVEKRELAVIDLTHFYGLTWEETLHKNNDDPPWGLSKIQWEKTRDLKCVMCIPVLDLRNERVLGVLNIDDKIPLENSHFRDEKVVNLVQACSVQCSSLLERIDQRG